MVRRLSIIAAAALYSAFPLARERAGERAYRAELKRVAPQP